MITRFTFAFSGFVITFLCCCFAAELVPIYVEKQPVEIVGGYSIGKTALSGLEFYGPSYQYS
jgi:hypothetical protein